METRTGEQPQSPPASVEVRNHQHNIDTAPAMVLTGARGFSVLLTPDEAAQVLSCSRATVYKMIAREQLPSVLDGQRVKVRAEDVDALVRLGTRT